MHIVFQLIYPLKTSSQETCFDGLLDHPSGCREVTGALPPAHSEPRRSRGTQNASWNATILGKTPANHVKGCLEEILRGHVI